MSSTNDDEDNVARCETDDSSRTPSSLWEVIVKCDDVCFQHISYRDLDVNDVKFLYGGECRDEKDD